MAWYAFAYERLFSKHEKSYGRPELYGKTPKKKKRESKTRHASISILPPPLQKGKHDHNHNFFSRAAPPLARDQIRPVKHRYQDVVAVGKYFTFTFRDDEEQGRGGGGFSI